MSEWTINEEFAILVGDNEVEKIENEITSEDVRRVARAQGIKQLGVRTTDGEKLAPEAFPVKQDVVLFQVNKAGL